MKLTSQLLKKIVMEEMKKFGAERDVEKVAGDTDEVDADELADSLEKKIDYAKALKIEESRLNRRLAKIVETRRRLAKSIARSV